jgi:L-asparaginase
MVCFAGKVFPARGAWKWSRSEPDAFLATTSNGRKRRKTFSGQLDPRVAIVKAYPGSDGTALIAELQRDLRGMIIEGLPGQGGIPSPMHEAVKKTAEQIPVVLSSRAPAGRLSREATGGTGEPLRGLGLISAQELSTEKAWLLLMVALAEANSIEEVRAIFAEIAAPQEEAK